MWINSNVQAARSRAQGLEAVRALGECQGADKHVYSPGTTLPQWQGRRKQICVGTIALQQDTDSCVQWGNRAFSLTVVSLPSSREADTWINAIYMGLP